MAHAHQHDHSNDHGHDHGHGLGRHHGAGAGGRVLLLALGVTLAFAGVEALSGWWSGSLALLGDAGHMLTDAVALGVASIAAVLSQRPPSERLSYGAGRVEVVAALVNGMFMLLVVVGIVREAFERFGAPRAVDAPTVMLVGGLGLAINLLVAWLLSRGEQSLNTRGALLHVMGDLLGSVAAIAAGLVIWFGGPTVIDPVLSLFICGLIVVSSVRLLREALHVIMEGVPPHLDLQAVGEAMAAADPAVREVHDLHIWSLSSGHVALSAHVVLDDLSHWLRVLAAEQAMLQQRYAIGHVTLQPETRGEPIGVIPIYNDGLRQNNGKP